MIVSASEIGVYLDTGCGFEGEVLHRMERGRWVVFLVDGKQKKHPVDYHDLPPGEYLMAKPS